MNKIYSWTELLSSPQRNQEEGFTLIELLVVLIIVGMLAAVSFPNLIAQVGKSREAETKSLVGMVARYQQAYHIERQTFASTLVQLNGGVGGIFGSQYHEVFDATIATKNIVKHQINAFDGEKYKVRNFAVGVYYSVGTYQIAICQSQGYDEMVEVGDTSSDDCTNNGMKIK